MRQAGILPPIELIIYDFDVTFYKRVQWNQPRRCSMDKRISIYIDIACITAPCICPPGARAKVDLLLRDRSLSYYNATNLDGDD
jgi:hypothetical protein